MDMDMASSGMFVPPQTLGTVLCCICGVPMEPNPANMCARCLRSRVDITEGLPRHAAIVHCPECSSWLQPPRSWLRAELESPALLSLCLRRIHKPLSRLVRLVHGEFVWTEPHSKRIHVKLRVQREALHGAILEQSHLVEFTVQDRLCESCSRAQASPDQWVATVQLRQHVPHRRTFFFLEQLILRHGAAARAVRIKETSSGVDFFFGHRSHAMKFVEFVSGVVPVRRRSDKQLVSHDTKSNNYNYKYTFSVEICPICREDLICLPPKVSNSLGNLGPLVICAKVSNSILLVDPETLRTAFLDADEYWRTPFGALLSSRQLVEFIVLDVKEKTPEVTVSGSRYCLARVEVARMSDFGQNDTTFDVKTHLGHLLKEGDVVLGYDLYSANSNDVEMDKYKGFELPYAILIKKSYEEKRQRKHGKQRKWRLKRMQMEVDDGARGRGSEEKRNNEYEEFLRELEENPTGMLDQMTIYKNKDHRPSETASMLSGDDDLPLDELISKLELSDDEEGEEDEDMAQ
ncbi:nonsense-mediated mRNA decay protein 3 [Dioscorea alata]|uniref:Nonsense-mediated mRNA decay protein 3 n=1 Tax=Dioscorea alata TaxID=55571 RepID=A0ACB7WHV1_DIOAL|nr:nonsense-mediated mRNA decay protein 3 [Dioscorea alata]